MSTEVRLPFIYFADPDRGRPLFNAKVYLGEVDQDPELFPIQAFHRQEDNNEVPVAQPLITGPGGVILINGSPAEIVVAEDAYSMRVLDNQDNEIYTLGDVTGAGATDPDIYVKRAGDTMTGPLTWLDPQGDNRMQTIDDVGFNGLRIFDLDGVNIDISLFTDGTDGVLLVAAPNGNLGFDKSQAEQGWMRFIIQQPTGVRNLVLGSPWPSDSATDGFNHYQLYFHREAETSTPFFVAETNDIIQAWIGPDGGASFSGAVEMRNFEDQSTPDGYGLYTTNAGRPALGGLPAWTGDTSLVMTPSTNITQGGGTPSTDFFSGEVYIQTRPVSGVEDFNRFIFAADGSLIVPSDIIIQSTGDSDQGSLQIQQIESTGSEGWYTQYVTNNVSGGTSGANLDGALILTPAKEIGGTVTPFSGEVHVQTSLFTDPNALNTSKFLDNGDLSIPGVLIAASSLRYKENVVPYEKGLDAVMALNPVTYTRKQSGREGIGFIAEEVSELGLDEFVSKDEQGPNGINYPSMVALMAKAIQELSAKVDALEERN
jgi:hypothetical protein